MIRLINSTLLRDDLLSQDIIIFASNQSGASLDPSTTESHWIVTGRPTGNDALCFYVASSAIGMDTEMRRYQSFATLLFSLLWAAFAGAKSYCSDETLSVATPIFFDDEVILSDNIRKLVEQIATLPAEHRFERLSQWVLPSTSHSGFRMNAEFLQTDAIPGSLDRVAEATCEGILSPCFALIRVAEQTGKLDELRRRIEAIPDPPGPHQLRAKLAMLMIVQSALRNETAALEMCSQLSQQVRVRGENRGGQWWPETLAMAWGMGRIKNRTELLELAAAMYDPQIGHSQWSGNTAWDIFIAGSYAQLQIETTTSDKGQGEQQTSFQHWKLASVNTANSRGNGYPAEKWQRRENAVHKVMGHDNDYLYFPVPLTGDFEVNCDVSGFNYRESQVAYAGLYASHNWRLSEVEIGGIRNLKMLPLDPPLTHPDDWLTCRIVTRGGVCRHYISGRLIYERILPESHSPWLALRTYRLSRGSVRNLTISGTPSIPDRVAMLANAELEDWFAYFDDSVADATDTQSWHTVMGTESTRELVHPAASELAGAAAESLLLYHRPMMEDGTIEYEFFYEPETWLVHPALDRLSFLIELDGVKTHWITDGQHDRSDLSPSNSVVSDEHAAGTAVPLFANDWNKTMLTLKGDEIQIALNGKPIFSRTLEASNRRQFGLFHFADKSGVRVRNMQWTGEWPKSMDPAIFPPAVRPDVATIDKAVSQLSQSYHHDFRGSSLPQGSFAKKAATIAATDEGVRTACQSEGGWQQTDLSILLEIGGDFDLQASFRNLIYSAKGNLGAQLMATLVDNGQEIRIARNRWDHGPEMMKFQVGSTKVNGRWEYSDTWTKQASTEGMFRLVRLSDKLHYLFAESETSSFRLLHTEKVGTEDLRLGDTSLSVFVDKIGQVSCVWTDLRIRAERLAGPALLNTKEILTTLNTERGKLPIHRVFDFEASAPAASDFYFDADETTWSKANKGLTLKATGQATWTASLLGSRQPIDGDFDVTLNVGETNLILPTDGQFSTLMWQVQQRENDRTRFASMFRRTPTEYKAVAQQHRTLPDGRHDYSWHGDVPVNSVASLRIARRGKVYTMLLRPVDGTQDEVVHQTEHATGPIVLHTLLHSGATGKDSKVLLKSIEIHAEQYGTPE